MCRSETTHSLHIPSLFYRLNRSAVAVAQFESCNKWLSRHLKFCNFANPDAQSVWLSKTTNDGLTRSGTGCFIAVPIWQQWASRG